MLKMSDIARHAGVSPTTVSFVLNDGPEGERISEQTRQKVLRAAEELGYRSNHLARAMRTGDTRMLGLLGGRSAEEQVGRMLEGALIAADKEGYTLKLLRLDAIDNSAHQAIRRASELRLMGMIALHLPASILNELHIEAAKYNTPLVVLDAQYEMPDVAQVTSDDVSGIEAGVAHLVALGHSRIAFIGGLTDTLTARKEAFEAAMSRHGLAIETDFIQNSHFRLRETSLAAARALLCRESHLRPTAIFCSGDLIALATLQVAAEVGVRVPHDLSLVGFANLTASEFATPPLTTIEQPFTEMGKVAVETLLGIISSRSNEGSTDGKKSQPFIKRVLPTQLIERASTGRIAR
ncbi:LacI family transcriptional regulator [bacterium]|nr:MAG: LacI family transcriptional regulator [bacterium]